jgi:methanethiol S-methyltransferase
MPATGFWWILLAMALYGAVHSILAANQTKCWVERHIGHDNYHHYYRLFFSVMGGLTFLPVLALVALLPDQTIYTIPSPWKYLTLALQVAAVLGVFYAVMQTGALAFVGIRQWLDYDPQHSSPQPEKLIINGLYRWVRHPIYTFSLLFIWLSPVMSWNTLALNLGVTAYFWIGSIFEERKLFEQFGKDYEEYRRHTPRIIPGIRI